MKDPFLVKVGGSTGCHKTPSKLKSGANLLIRKNQYKSAVYEGLVRLFQFVTIDFKIL